MSEEEKIPYLVENKERDTFTIYVKGTKPYLELQQKNNQLKNKIRNKIKDLEENNNGDDYSLENVVNILKDLLGDKENEEI